MSEHIVKSFDEELQKLKTTIGQMSGLTETQLDHALQAVLNRDTELAEKVVEADAQIDSLERTIDQMAVRLLALRQPMAVDLRHIVGALKVASDLERIGDLAKNIAKRSIAINQMNVPLRPGLRRMARLVQLMLKDVLDAYLANDVDRAVDVWRRDEEVDEIYTSLFRELLTYMMEDPRSITGCTHYLFIAKNIERMGDHATNIAENIYFEVKGETLISSRPKSDDANYTVVEHPTKPESK